MGLAEVQAALAKLAIDDPCRTRFFSDPVAAANELGLSAAEAISLACIPQVQIDRFAASLHRKRRDQIRHMLPLAVTVLGTRFASLFADYAAQAPARGSTADLDDPLGFVASLSARRPREPLEPSWIVDLARYELAWRQAMSGRGHGPRLLIRLFGHPVHTLNPENLAPKNPGSTLRPLATLPPSPSPSIGFWWRLGRDGRVRHAVLALPRLRRSAQDLDPSR
jgi:hypothetical protein